MIKTKKLLSKLKKYISKIKEDMVIAEYFLNWLIEDIKLIIKRLKE